MFVSYFDNNLIGLFSEVIGKSFTNNSNRNKMDSADAKPGLIESFTRKYQYVMDKSSPHVLYRWIFFLVIFSIYFIRVYFLDGWFIVTYALGIYLLNQLIGFLSPQVRNKNSKYP